MSNLCEGQVVLVTGAGRGIGRSEAIGFAREGARVVVADIGAELDGTGRSGSVAESVVEEIRSFGGEAIAGTEDVGDWDGAKRLVELAVTTWGRLDVLVNNAGNQRDKMIFNMSEDDFDAVVRVHLKGTFALTRWAAVHWREKAKQGPNAAAVVNTSSPAGLYGSAGQQNYSAAKAGITIQTVGVARELRRYGVRANAISPAARTRMTNRSGRPADAEAAAFDPRDPDNVAPLVVWLGSPASAGVTGQVFEVRGGSIAVAEGWRTGPSAEKDGRWLPSELTGVVPDLVAAAYQLPDPTGGGGRTT